MMKVLYCKNSFAGPISGADEIAVTYAVELRRAGHSTAVLLVHPPTGDDPLAARLRAAGVPLTSLASPAFSGTLAACRRLAIRAMRAFTPASGLIRTNSRRIVFDLLQRYHDACRAHLERERPDVVHVLTPDPGAVMIIRAAHAAGVPVVYQEVGIPFHPPGFEEVYERFVKVLPLCAEVAALSPCLAREMGGVLPQLGTPSVLPLISANVPEAAAPPTPGSDAVRFGFAARLEHLKGPLQLVEGFRLAHVARPSVELWIAGEGSQRQQVALTLRRHGLEGKCRLGGVYKTLEERSRFMRGIDVFVLPSLTEGTPNAIIEAMAHARPSVATAVGGIPDLLAEGAGIIVPPNDPAALGEAMARLACDADLRRKMGLAAREKYERTFAPNAVLPMLLDFYRRVVERHGAGNDGAGLTPQQVTHPWSGAARSEASHGD